MTKEERKLALYCLKASSDYHSEVCEECIKYPNCDHTGQDDVTETIIKALEQEPKHCKECKWWKDKDGVYRRGIRAESKCPLNRREVMEGKGYCFLFEPQESEEKE